MIKALVAAVLAVSVGFNLRSLLSERGSSTGVAQCPASGPKPQLPTAPARVVLPPLENCAADLAQTRVQLAQTRAALEERIEAQTRFASAAREEALEVRVKPAVENALAKMKGVTGHLECRGTMCQVRVSAGTRAESQRAWDVFTKDPEIRSFAGSFHMDAGEPVVDLASGKGAFESDFFFTTKSLEDFSGTLEELVASFRASSALDDCASSGQDNGVLEVKIEVVPNEQRLGMAVGGSLAGTAVGRCIAARLSELVLRFQVPAGLRFGQVYASFEPSRPS